jgi:glycosyltransferase involved in cell wall biosynthesis
MKKEHPVLIWVNCVSLVKSLDRATWLETSSELCDLGWHVTLVAVDFPMNEIDKRIRPIRLPRPKFYLVGYLIFHFLLSFRLIFDLRNADIVLFHQQSAPFLLPLVLLRNLLGRHWPKFVMDSRTANMVTSSLKGGMWNIFFNNANTMANRLADGQTTITARLAQMQGIPDQQLLGNWPSGVNPERFTQSYLSRRWPDKNEPLRLIYLGALYKERNLMALIDAVRLVRNEGYNVAFDLVGEGPQKKELEAAAHCLEDGVIRVLSAVPSIEVPRIIATAHIGALPFPNLPIFQVSSPIKLFEYMAAGMPILATRIACHTDVLGDGDFVFWAEDGDPAALASAIREAFAHRTEFGQMGSRAIVAAQDWTWKNSAKKLDTALRKLFTEN